MWEWGHDIGRSRRTRLRYGPAWRFSLVWRPESTNVMTSGDATVDPLTHLGRREAGEKNA